MNKLVIVLAIALIGFSSPAMAKKKTLKVSTELNGAEKQKLSFEVDKDGYICIFDGKTTKGWRSYGKDYLSPRWTVDNGCLHFKRGQGEGGDIIFAHKFKNFILEMEWKIQQGGNSGIFYLG